MKKPALVMAICLPVLAGLGQTAGAAGYEVAEQSPVAAGTASAGAARAGDPSAAWFNPAALTDGFGLRVGVGLSLAMPSIEAAATDDSWSGETDSPVSTPPHLYLSYARNSWALGLSVNVPYASSTTWPEGWDGRFEGIYSRPQFFRVAPFFGWRFGPVGVAAGPHLDLGKLDVRRGLDFIDAEGDVRVLVSGVGLGFHASVFWRAFDFLDLGITYKSRTHLTLTGSADFTTPDAFSTRTPDQSARAAWVLPDKIVIGAATRLGDVRVLADLGVSLWSVNRELVIDFENEDTPDRVQPNGWTTTLAVRAGSEWAALPWLVARIGAFYDPSPVPAGNLYPSAPDSTRAGFTLGASFHFLDYFHLDAFYEFLWLLSRESTGDDAPLVRYAGNAHFFGFGLRFELPNAPSSAF